MGTSSRSNAGRDRRNLFTSVYLWVESEHLCQKKMRICTKESKCRKKKEENIIIIIINPIFSFSGTEVHWESVQQ
jgi:hypothetical protein